MLSSPVLSRPLMSLSQSSVQREINVWLCDFCKEAFFHDYDEACVHEEACTKRKAEICVAQENLPVLASGNVSKRKSVQTLFAPILPKSRNLVKKHEIASSKVADLAPIFVGSRTAKESLSKCKLKNKSVMQSRTEDKHVSTNNRKRKCDAKQYAVPKRSCSDSTSTKGLCCELNVPMASIFSRKTTKSDKRIDILKDVDDENDKKSQEIDPISRLRKKAATSMRAKTTIYDRFPVPSHIGIIPYQRAKGESRFGEELSILRKTLAYQSGNEYRSVHDSSLCNLRGPTFEPEIDLICRILSSTLGGVTKEGSKDQYLWTEKYKIHNIPLDVCGASNKTIAEKCIKFVLEWKAKRSEARERRALRQDRLARGKKLSVGKRKQDMWDDDASDEDQIDLPSLCLLIGPVGCGKTSLVHAVAKHCDCKVMEINTTEKRSNQSLRNAIEEATQSESTFDLLKPRVNDLVLSHDLIDSEDEVEPPSSSVPIILIDEVDLLFENEGDSGFWNALKSLSRKAKCPIFLTANEIPLALNAMSIPNVQFSIVRPSPDECVNKLWQIIKSENLTLKQNVDVEQTKQALAAFSSLLDCDIRRIILELQLFSTSSDFCINRDLQMPFLLPVPLSERGFNRFKGEPEITRANPPFFSPDNEMTLTLEGASLGCLGHFCSVTVGNLACETIDVKESSVQVRCPLLHTWKSPDSLRTETLSKRFPRFRIKTKPAFPQLMLGIEYHHYQLGDGTSILETSQTTLEFRSGSSQGVFDIESGDESQELIDSDSHKTSKLISDDEDCSVSAKNDLSGKWCVNKESARACDDLDELSKVLELKSASAFIGDSMTGLPLLAGACRGFGTEFIDEITSVFNTIDSKRLSQKRAPPPIERIILQGWNEHGFVFGSSDTLVTLPCTRERRLLSDFGCFGHTPFPPPSTSSIIDPSMNPDEDDQGQDNFLSNEFSFLQTRSSSLSSEISTHLNFLLSQPSEPTEYELRNTEMRRQRAIEHTCDFFAKLFDVSTQGAMFPHNAARMRHAAGETINQIFLDYSPILSKICLYETDAMSWIETQISDSISSGKRSTRRSKLQYFCPYLSTINRMLPQGDCLEVGHKQCNYVLRW